MYWMRSWGYEDMLCTEPCITIHRLGLCGGGEGDRTPDLSIANAALSHLSYTPTDAFLIIAVFFPQTSPL